MRKVVMVYCIISFLYVISLKSQEARYNPVDDLAVELNQIHIQENQVAQLEGMLESLSLSRHPQKTQLIALVIKAMAYDCQQYDGGNAIISLIACHQKKMLKLPLDYKDIKGFSESLQKGEPEGDRKKMAEETLFAMMTGRGRTLPEGWRLRAGKDQTDVFDQLKAWRETSSSDLASWLPRLPLENLFSSELDLSADVDMAVV